MASRADSIVFSSASIAGLELPNRLMRSATFENAATPEGEVTDTLVDLYTDLARGGVGLIVTGIMGVYPRAIGPRIVRIDDDSLIPGLARIAAAVHESGAGCKIMAQLHHPGRQVIDPAKAASLFQYVPPALVKVLETAQPAEGAAEEPEEMVEPTAPSALYDTFLDQTPRELTLGEIDEIIDAFAAAVRRARKAGFDGVQLHAAHGWLLSSFLSPHTNRRDDEYGGSTENRVRIVREIYERARKLVGEDFPILIKMNTTDFFPDGTDIEEAVKVTEILAETGFAAVESSGGMWEAVMRGQDELGWPAVILPESRTQIKRKDQEAYFLPGAKVLKERLDIPVILVGGMKSFSVIEEILEAGWADLVSLSRPLIRQPDLPNLWRADDQLDRAACLSCNACLPMGPNPLRCMSLPHEHTA
jgi:2,4-dienoyl-CoA reductase-like NADH-dependent reductase (Old Yellow Enzyme family)